MSAEFLHFISVFLLLLGFWIDAERDTIQFRPIESWFPLSEYWTKKAKKGSSIFQQTILCAFGDGWHLMKTFYLWSWQGSFVIIICLHFALVWYIGLITWLFLWFMNGVVFELTYGSRDEGLV